MFKASLSGMNAIHMKIGHFVRSFAEFLSGLKIRRQVVIFVGRLLGSWIVDFEGSAMFVCHGR